MPTRSIAAPLQDYQEKCARNNGMGTPKNMAYWRVPPPLAVAAALIFRRRTVVRPALEPPYPPSLARHAQALH